MITAVLFDRFQKDGSISSCISEIEELYQVGTRSRIAPTVIDKEWVVRCEPAKNIYIHDVIGISQYDIAQAVHISTSKEDFASNQEVYPHAIDYLNVLFLTIATISPDYGVCNLDGAIKPRNIPSTGELREGQCKAPSWLNVFGPEYVDRYGEATLLDAPAWYTTKVDDCVVVIAHKNPNVPGNGYSSTHEVERELQEYLEANAPDN